MNKSFEINLPILNKKRLIIYLGALLFVLILDIILFKPIKINKTYAKEDISYLNNISWIAYGLRKDQYKPVVCNTVGAILSLVPWTISIGYSLL